MRSFDPPSGFSIDVEIFYTRSPEFRNVAVAGDNEGLGINIPVAGNKPVVVGNIPGVDCNRVRQTADRKAHGAWAARHTNCCWVSGESPEHSGI